MNKMKKPRAAKLAKATIGKPDSVAYRHKVEADNATNRRRCARAGILRRTIRPLVTWRNAPPASAIYADSVKPTFRRRFRWRGPKIIFASLPR